MLSAHPNIYILVYYLVHLLLSCKRAALRTSALRIPSLGTRFVNAEIRVYPRAVARTIR